MNVSFPEYAAKRAWMVETQLRGRGIGDPRVLKVFSEVPRHEFVPPGEINQAYEDCPLPIGEGQTISQPYIVAAMTEALALTGAERVLEVGTGSGYQAAILAQMTKHVFSIETHPELSNQARQRLERLGYQNITCIVGDGSQGYPAEAPYGAILVTAAAPRIPDSLTEQLGEGGRLVIPVGDIHTQELLLSRKEHRKITQKTINYCRFVPLTGRYGWGGG